MNRKKRTKQILQFLLKNPLSTTRDIADKTSRTRINHNIMRKILVELLQTGKIDQLLGHYYVVPTIKNEISLLAKIAKLDSILKPKFKKLSYDNRIRHGEFQHILELYILLIRLRFKVHKIESLRTKKSYSLDRKDTEKIQKDLIKYLRTFRISSNTNFTEFHKYLIKHIDDRYFKDSRYFYDLMFRARTLKERVKMLSAFFKTNSVKEISDQFGYESNKVPRRMVDAWFHENKNIHFDEIYAGILTGEIKNSDASDLFLQWWAYIGLTNKTTKDNREFTEKELKQYRKNFMKNFKKLYKIDVRRVVDVRAYGIS